MTFGELVQRGVSVPYPFWQTFMSRKGMKIVCKVANRCLSYFMVETSGYDSLRNNQGPLWFDGTLPYSMYRWDRRWPVCRLTGHRCQHRPTLRMVEKVPSHAQPLNSSTEYWDASYDPCVDLRRVDDTVIPHLDNWRKSLACTCSDKDNGVQDVWGMSFDSHMARMRGLVCEGPKLLHVFNLVYLIN